MQPIGLVFLDRSTVLDIKERNNHFVGGNRGNFHTFVKSNRSQYAIK